MKRLFKVLIIVGLGAFALDRLAGVILYYLDPEFRRLLDGKKRGADDVSRTREDVQAVLINQNGTETVRSVQ